MVSENDRWITEPSLMIKAIQQLKPNSSIHIQTKNPSHSDICLTIERDDVFPNSRGKSFIANNNEGKKYIIESLWGTQKDMVAYLRTANEYEIVGEIGAIQVE